MLKINELINLCKKFQEFIKLPSHKNFFLNVNRKGIYFIWMRLKSRRAELKQRVKVRLAKYVGMITFRHDCSFNKRFITTNTKPRIFRIPKNQNVANPPSRRFSFCFSIEALIIFSREGRKKPVHSSIVY